MAHPFRSNMYFVDPAGFQFEFIEYQSEEPAERNSYEHDSGQSPLRHAK